MEDKAYPKFQWSIFVKNGRDQQFVVRANDVEEFAKLIREAKGMIGEEIVNPTPVAATPTVVTPEVRVNTAGMFCMTCKAPAEQKSGIAKTGRPYNAIFCSSKDSTHTKWI